MQGGHVWRLDCRIQGSTVDLVFHCHIQRLLPVTASHSNLSGAFQHTLHAVRIPRVRYCYQCIQYVTSCGCELAEASDADFILAR